MLYSIKKNKLINVLNIYSNSSLKYNNYIIEYIIKNLNYEFYFVDIIELLKRLVRFICIQDDSYKEIYENKTNYLEAIIDISLYLAIKLIPKEELMEFMEQHGSLPKILLTDTTKNYINTEFLNFYYSENIRVTVNYWSEKLFVKQIRGLDDTSDNVRNYIYGNKKICEEDKLKNFQNRLADGISKELEKNGKCEVYIDDIPCDLLRYALKGINVDLESDLPSKLKTCTLDNSVYLYKNKNNREIIRELWSGKTNVFNFLVKK